MLMKPTRWQYQTTLQLEISKSLVYIMNLNAIKFAKSAVEELGSVMAAVANIRSQPKSGSWGVLSRVAKCQKKKICKSARELGGPVGGQFRVKAVKRNMDFPSVKLFIKQLKSCVPHDVGKKIPDWSCQWNGQELTFSLTWIQGIVEQTFDHCDTLELNDKTGTIRIKGCNKIPFQSAKVVAGQYLLVIGQPMKENGCLVIRAIKIQNLSPNSALEKMWPLEVMDQMMYLTNNSRSSHVGLVVTSHLDVIH